jgi:tetratricopeptide (TPR) repeat protein
MARQKKSVFLSYSWKNMVEVNHIDTQLLQFGIEVKRDVRDLKEWENIPSFMRKIKSTDYVIIFLSKTYLQSPNCMFEVAELMEVKNYNKRVIIILTDCQDHFSAESLIYYHKFWQTQKTKLTQKLKNIRQARKALSLKLKIVTRILRSLAPFLTANGTRLNLTYDELSKQSLKPLLVRLGLKENLFNRQLSEIEFIKHPELQSFSYEELSQQYPNNFYIWLKRSLLENKRGQFYLSLAFLEKAIQANPGNAVLEYNKADLLNHIGKMGEALRITQRLTKKYPSQAVIWSIMGASYWGKKDYESSIKCFDKALELDPIHLHALKNLAFIHHDHSEPIAAIEFCLKYLNITAELEEPENQIEIIRIWRCLILSYLATLQPQEAVISAKKANATYPNDPALLQVTALAYARQRDFITALDYVDKSIFQKIDDYKSWELKARIQKFLNNYDQAYNACLQSLQLLARDIGEVEKNNSNPGQRQFEINKLLDEATSVRQLQLGILLIQGKIELFNSVIETDASICRRIQILPQLIQLAGQYDNFISRKIPLVQWEKLLVELL